MGHGESADLQDTRAEAPRRRQPREVCDPANADLGVFSKAMAVVLGMEGFLKENLYGEERLACEGQT